MSDNNKVVKFKKRRSINIGVIVFLILFVYIAFNVYFYLTKEQLSIYEVHEGTTAVDNRIQALIIREEEVITSDQAGYVTYYQKEGARVAKHTSVYSLDDSGRVADILESGDIPVTMSKKDSAELLHTIKSFRNAFNDENFHRVYDFKEDAQSTVLESLNNTMLLNETTIRQETGQSFSYHMVKSPQSGIVSYYIDGYETVTLDNLSADLFLTENYVKTGLRTNSMIDINTPVYKLITSEQWSLVFPLTQEQYGRLQGKEQAKFTILEDDFELSAALTLTQMNSQYYGQLVLNKYLSNYLRDRFLEIELDFDTVEGLKIPLSAITEKSFYLVPLEYLSKGADSTDSGLIIESYDEKTGEVKYTFTVTDIYYQDEAYAYVDMELFPDGTFIHSPSGSQRYVLKPTNRLTGVYNVNLGYAVFKRIEILYQNEEYAIVSDTTEKGLSAYDQIALDGKTAVDQAIIY